MGYDYEMFVFDKGHNYLCTFASKEKQQTLEGKVIFNSKQQEVKNLLIKRGCCVFS